MSFVKDDHSYTRGVGAVASMDAGSSRRRTAAALGALRMARRDAVMARHTLGRISQTENGGGGGSGGGGSTGGGGVRPPPLGPVRPSRPGVQPLPPKPVPPKINIRDFATIRNLAIGTRPDVRVVVDPVKLPGAQVVDVKPEPAPPPKDQVLPPPKTVTIVASPGIAPLPPKPAAPSGGGFPGFAPEPEIDVTVDAQPVTAPPAAKKPNYLLYAALGIGAYWLLTRKG